MDLALRLIERAGRTALRLAPASFRADWQPDIIATLHEVCLDARQRRGLPGFAIAAMRELGNVASQAARARMGARPAVSGGSQPPPNRPPRARWTSILAADVRLARRGLAATKLATAIAVGTLAIGIGINAAVFSILDATVLRPMPFASGDRLVEVWNLTDSGVSYPGFTRALLAGWRTQSDLFDRLEAYDIMTLVHDAQDGAEMATGAVVTPRALAMLGVPPLQGRTFVEGDCRGGTDAIVVIGERFWQKALGRTPDVIGRRVSFNGRPHTVVGVMPASFRFPGHDLAFWLPYDLDQPPAAGFVRPRLTAFARLAPGVSLDQADAQVRTRGKRLAAAAGVADPHSAKIFDRHAFGGPKTRQSLAVLGAAALFLLLIVCANLANLSLSRMLGRAREYAVQSALGASRMDLARQSLVENLILGLAGAAAGLAIAAGVLEITLRVLPATLFTASFNAIDLDGRAVAFTAIAGVVTAIVFGLAPAILASRVGIAGLLQRGSRSSTGSPASRRMRGALVVIEVTLAIVLLVGAALMTRSFVRLQQVDRGFDTAGLVSMTIGLPAAAFGDPYVRDAFVDDLLARARLLPDVSATTAGHVPPQTSQLNFGQIERSNRPGVLSEDITLPVYMVWPNYFSTIGLPLRAGRPFAPGEPLTSAIVSESFASVYWPDGNAVGSEFRFKDGRWYRIVGVAGEVRQLEMDDAEGRFEVYFPLQRPRGVPLPSGPAPGESILTYRTIVARTADPDATLERLRRAVHDADRRVVIWRTASVDRMFADAVARPRVVLLLMTVFAGFGLVLSAAGIYGVLSYLVAQRRREIGIRLALGAKPQAVGRLVFRHGLTFTVIGLGVGVVSAVGLVRLMRALLYEVAPTDAVSLLAVIALVTAVAALASWWPARRAMRVDPVSLLRED